MTETAQRFREGRGGFAWVGVVVFLLAGTIKAKDVMVGQDLGPNWGNSEPPAAQIKPIYLDSNGNEIKSDPFVGVATLDDAPKAHIWNQEADLAETMRIERAEFNKFFKFCKSHKKQVDATLIKAARKYSYWPEYTNLIETKITDLDSFFVAIRSISADKSMRRITTSIYFYDPFSGNEPEFSRRIAE